MTNSSDDPANLTLAKLLQVKHEFEAKLAAADADAYVRLGDKGYRGYNILKRAGLVLVGGHERGGSKGPAIVAELRDTDPMVNVRLTEFLPDGQITLLDTSLPSVSW